MKCPAHWFRWLWVKVTSNIHDRNGQKKRPWEQYNFHSPGKRTLPVKVETSTGLVRSTKRGKDRQSMHREGAWATPRDLESWSCSGYKPSNLSGFSSPLMDTWLVFLTSQLFGPNSSGQHGPLGPLDSLPEPLILTGALGACFSTNQHLRYPLVNSHIAIENGHRNSGYSH